MTAKTPLILPALDGFYDRFAKPLAFVVLRLIVGAMLVMEGWPKVQAPFAMAGFTEDLGLAPGWFWSALLAYLQFGGGLLILAGLLTRPAALANGIMLAVTYWFHLTHPYGVALLSPDGMAALSQNAALYTPDGLRNFAGDGGANFLEMIQFKAEGLSALWTVAALFLAAWGAGPLSVDRTILKREF